MRSFALVVFDIDNSIIDKYPLGVVTNLSGLGWKLNLSKIEGDVSDILTKVVQEKQSIKVTMNLIGRGYEKFAVFTQWVQKYSFADSRLALEYNDGVQKRYIEGKLTELKKTEKDKFDNLACEAVFTALTPFFSSIENVVKIQIAAEGKNYSFKYPYSYGKNVIENNEIDNPYISPVPVTVKIYGSISNPVVQLLDEGGNSYCRVQFTGITLTDGQYIIINSATRKIYFFNGTALQDYTAETDPNYDTFLLAESGKSTLSINLAASDSGYLIGSWRQYSL